MNVFKNGFMTGLILQMAIGPVFFFIANLALQGSFRNGIVGAFAIAIVDWFYITLSILGVGTLLNRSKMATIFGVVSSLVLLGFGILIIRSAMGAHAVASVNNGSASIAASFVSVFVLGITSPMTMIVYTGLFTAKALEYHYATKELAVFGFGTGLATFVFMISSVLILSILKTAVPIMLIRLLNGVVGLLLIGYGGMRLIKTCYAFNSRALARHNG